MDRKILKSKIHRADVSGTELHYEGSITIDKYSMDQAGLHEFEFDQIVNISNGHCLETYILAGDPDSGIIELNGAAARLACIGDKISIMAYVHFEEPLLKKWQSTILMGDDQNAVREVLC